MYKLIVFLKKPHQVAITVAQHYHNILFVEQGGGAVCVGAGAAGDGGPCGGEAALIPSPEAGPHEFAEPAVDCTGMRCFTSSVVVQQYWNMTHM
jgi:hypothetical protein